MFRLVALIVVLTHLGVVSAPCCDEGFAPERLSGLAHSDGQPTHPPSVPPVVEEATRPAEHAHHHHGRDASHAVARAPVEIEPAKKTQIVSVEIRAVCLCGCSTNTNSPGTTTSPRLGFALFPAVPPRLVEAEPSVGVLGAARFPVAIADTLDHVPILSS